MGPMGDSDRSDHKKSGDLEAKGNRYTFSLVVKINKEKNWHNCHKQWKQFSQFVLLVDGMMGKEAQFLITTLI